MEEQLTRSIIMLVEEWGQHPCTINDGGCDTFAKAIKDMVPEVETMWGDEISGKFPELFHDFLGEHCFIRLNDKYYDAEEPEGVKRPDSLPYYQRLERIILDKSQKTW